LRVNAPTSGSGSLPEGYVLSTEANTASGFGQRTSFKLAADLNGDGRIDLISLAGEVLLGNGDGTFQAPKPLGPIGVSVVADVNSDGRPDLIGEQENSESGPEGAVVLLGNGDGTFQAPRLISNPLFVRAATDINGDGY